MTANGLHKKFRKFAQNRQRSSRQTENSKTEATLIPCGSWVAGQLKQSTMTGLNLVTAGGSKTS